MFCAGAANLEANKDWINELNVFPVPDGDTGTNMTLTIKSAVSEVAALGDTDSMKDVCKAMSSGSLRGARGNSGVILSQLIRGFGKIARGETELTVPILADAFDRAVETAYKAVMKPKEGTILTVAKGAAEKARALADAGTTDLEEFLCAVVEEADQTLQKTPDMLPVLKQAGVVDSGGQGLVQVLKGALDCFQGKEIDYAALAADKKAAGGSDDGEKKARELAFVYRVRIIVMIDKKPGSREQKEYLNFLESMGEKAKCSFDGEDRIRVRVHTNDPGMVIQRTLKLGEIAEARVSNLRLEEELAEEADAPGNGDAKPFGENSGEEAAAGPEPAAEENEAVGSRKEVGFIAVSAGDGLAEIFRGLGVDYVISGGQTMNPSTDDILQAISRVNADTIYVLPNNKNIVMAANQAADLTEDKKIVVIPTATVPQGITAIINYMPDLDAEANKANMVEEIGTVHSAEITYAVRDTVIDDISISQGDIMAIGDSGILATGSSIEDTAITSLEKIAGDETEIISIYYGADVSEEDAQKLRERVAAKFESCDVDLQFGGQPIYYYILSAE